MSLDLNNLAPSNNYDIFKPVQDVFQRVEMETAEEDDLGNSENTLFKKIHSLQECQKEIKNIALLADAIEVAIAMSNVDRKTSSLMAALNEKQDVFQKAEIDTQGVFQRVEMETAEEDDLGNSENTLFKKIHSLQQCQKEIEDVALLVDEMEAMIALSKVDRKTSSLMAALNEKLKISTKNASPNAVSKVQVLGQFSIEDLTTFRAALQSPILQEKCPDGMKLVIRDQAYMVWFNGKFSSINIQSYADWKVWCKSDNKLGVIIDPSGKITSIWLNGQPQENDLMVPEDWVPLLHEAFKEALKESSIYREKTFTFADPVLAVEIVRRGLKEVPEFHLINLCSVIPDQIGPEGTPRLEVIFLNDDLSKSDGLDGGGLARDYLDELMEGLIQSKMLSFEQVEGTPVFLPQAKTPYEIHPFSLLTEPERILLEALGKLIMYCWNSKPSEEGPNKMAQIGNHFDVSLFQTALSLSADEIDMPFEDLPNNVKLKMAKVLLQRKMDLDQSNASAIQFQFLNPLAILMGEAELTEDCITLFNDYLDLKEDTIITNEQQKSEFKEALQHYVLTASKVGNKLSAIHSIAKGMKSFKGLDWDGLVKTCKPIDFSLKVQGCVDRQLIVDSFVPEDIKPQDVQEITKKVNWLKEWLGDKVGGATDKEVIDFLKYATGSSGLPVNVKIPFVSHIGTKADPHKPFPEAHTCSMKLRIAPEPCAYGEYNDYTKENYIRSLKELALANKSLYNMD
jgi:hypothetical protein